MTPTEQLAAIRAALDGYTLPSQIVMAQEDWGPLSKIVAILAADQPTPEPLVDTLPPGPVICPNCGEDDQWREWAYVAVSQPVSLQDESTGRYAWEISNDPVWEDQKHDCWECEACEYHATPAIAAALTIRANA